MCEFELTEEGTRLFFEELEKPNPRRDAILKRGKEMLNGYQRSRIGLERVKVTFKIKQRIENEI